MYLSHKVVKRIGWGAKGMELIAEHGLGVSKTALRRPRDRLLNAWGESV